MTNTHLTGLEGTNPLGFFAALGVQVALEESGSASCLWWSDDAVPYAIVEESVSIEEIVDRAKAIFSVWLNSNSIATGLDPVGDVKFNKSNIRTYLANAGYDSSFASCLVAEGSFDNKGAAKPTDFYFTAGQQKFLKIVEDIFSGVTTQDLTVGLIGPWSYDSHLSSLMWDVGDDRNYALAASDPSKDKKLTNPGPEALAILGISRYPVFGSLNRTLTQGAFGTWKDGFFTWPIWSEHASFRVVSSLLAHVTGFTEELHRRSVYYPSWGVTRVMQSSIKRSDQGGYGTFGPPKVVWSCD
ncbi:hypothetical protein [Candidatus Poriferisocius sp.]|uniref:type I-G CRISPR-associated protein, Cas3-extension family n=1 Tax=Candidatus Poriferisocius sp. TaxID=3101276 RepID=UPI003B01ECE2